MRCGKNEGTNPACWLNDDLRTQAKPVKILTKPNSQRVRCLEIAELDPFLRFQSHIKLLNASLL